MRNEDNRRRMALSFRNYGEIQDVNDAESVIEIDRAATKKILGSMDRESVSILAVAAAQIDGLLILSGIRKLYHEFERNVRSGTLVGEAHHEG